jgi:hypothetical protein
MANTSKDTPAKKKPVTLWRAGRSRFSVGHLRRGDKHTWTFSGQQSGEDVLLVVRRHWLFLLPRSWPLVVALIAFVATVVLAMSFPAQAALWITLVIITFLLVLAAGVWLAYRDLLTWWYETYIVTNKRIINARGLLEPTRQQTPLDKVSQVGVGVDSVLGLLFNFGTVHVYLAGGDFFIRDVPNPKGVADAIQGITATIKANKPPDKKAPMPTNPEIADVLDALAKGRSVAQLPNADEDLPPLRNQGGFLGPRRTFGGILRIPCNVRYVSGEYTVKYIQRSRYILWRNLLTPGALLAILTPITLFAPGTGIVPPSIWLYWWMLMGLVVVALVLAILLVYTNYVDDVYILTNRRIIDIQRHFIFFFETRLETEYKNIRDIRVKVPSVFARFFDVGNVYVETPGSNPDVILDGVDHPFVLQDEILGIKSHKDKVDAAKKENDEKATLHRWFGTVLTKIEETSKGRGTPNLKNMDVLTAMACAQEYGLDVIVTEEAETSHTIPPGHVLRQSPPPGTMMEVGSRIEIVLSKRPAPIDIV